VKNSEIPELTEELEEGFVDLTLKMEGLVRKQDGMQQFEARASHKGRVVAFAVALGTTWRPIEGTSEEFYCGEARLISLGDESDAFIQVLDQLYETKAGTFHMGDNIRFTAVSLEGHPDRLAVDPLKMKMFFESENDDLCAEFYLNCDVNRNRVQFREKDTDFRAAVILALAQNEG
jgi:hypothetical protein